MQLKATFFKHVLFFFAFSLVIASCGSDEGEDTPPPSNDPAFKAEVDMMGYLQTELGFDEESFESDFERDFSVGGADFDEEDLPADAKGAFAFNEDGLIIMMAASYDGADTSNFIFSINPFDNFVGSYDLIFDIDIFDNEGEGLMQGQGDVLFLSSKLPEEFLFLYFFGALTIDQGNGMLNITEYDSEANTISGNFSYTYTLDADTDDGPVNEEAIRVSNGTFNKIPLLQ